MAHDPSNQPERDPGDPPGRETGRPDGDAAPGALDPPAEIDRLSVLTHELRSLLDGCLRRVSLARRDLHAEDGATTDVEGVRRQLDFTRGVLEQMAQLVGRSMQGSALPLGSALVAPGGVTLGDAVEHAAEVLTPRAEAHSVAIRLDVEDAAARAPAGPLYVVVLNALSNAIDSSVLAGGGREVHLRARRRSPDLRIEVTDDGIGLVAGVEPAELFSPGATTKSGGRGIGLAVCREIVESLGGRIEIANRRDAARGALLSLTVPEPEAQPDDPASPTPPDQP